MSSTSKDVQDSYKRYHKINNKEDCNMSTSVFSLRSAAPLMVGALSGMIFGLAMQKSRVFEPHKIRDQMTFTDFTMIKMFLSATAVGMLNFSLLSMIPATSGQFQNIIDDFVGSLSSKSVSSVAVGGTLLGCGMTIAGACPGMVFAQVGSAVPGAMLTLLGGLCGAYLYALFEPPVARLLNPNGSHIDYSIDEYLESPYFIVALPLASLLGMAVFAIEVFWPSGIEVKELDINVLYLREWSPIVAGVMIGMLQLPVVLFLGTTLGSTTGYMTMASQALVIKPLQSLLPHLKKFRDGVGNWWQVFYLGGAVVGAHLSARASGSLGDVSGVGHWNGFLGGVLMIYGARVAGGCTSGHGLSGMALLMLLSLVAVPFIFVGGISMAAIMKFDKT